MLKRYRQLQKGKSVNKNNNENQLKKSFMQNSLNEGC